MELNVKKLVLIDACYEDVIVSESTIALLYNMLHVRGDGFEIYVNPDMIMSIELLKQNKVKEMNLKR